MTEGPRVILRLPKIRQAIFASPEPMLWFSKKRMELEIPSLEYVNIHTECQYENGVVDKSDEIMQAILRRRIELLVEVALWMRLEGSAVNDLEDICNSMLM